MASRNLTASEMEALVVDLKETIQKCVDPVSDDIGFSIIIWQPRENNIVRHCAGGRGSKRINVQIIEHVLIAIKKDMGIPSKMADHVSLN